MDPFDLREWRSNLSESAIVDEIAIDSRRISSPNSLFVALSGNQFDGHQFVVDAETRGARFALVNESWQPSRPLKTLSLLRVANPLYALQEIAKVLSPKNELQNCGRGGVLWQNDGQRSSARVLSDF